MRWYHVLATATWLLSLECTLAQSPDGLVGQNDRIAPRYSRHAQSTSVAQSRSERPQTSNSPAGSGGFADQFWEYLKRGPVAYDEWQAFPGKPTRLYQGRSPHGSKIRLVANRKARQSREAPVLGSIFLVENYNGDGSRLLAITVMYRSPGYDPDHQDWFWAKYLPEGRLAEVNKRPLAGRVGSCIECHQTAGGGDYVFSNDLLAHRTRLNEPPFSGP